MARFDPVLQGYGQRRVSVVEQIAADVGRSRPERSRIAGFSKPPAARMYVSARTSTGPPPGPIASIASIRLPVGAWAQPGGDQLGVKVEAGVCEHRSEAVEGREAGVEGRVADRRATAGRPPGEGRGGRPAAAARMAPGAPRRPGPSGSAGGEAAPCCRGSERWTRSAAPRRPGFPAPALQRRNRGASPPARAASRPLPRRSSAS